MSKFTYVTSKVNQYIYWHCCICAPVHCSVFLSVNCWTLMPFMKSSYVHLWYLFEAIQRSGNILLDGLSYGLHEKVESFCTLLPLFCRNISSSPMFKLILFHCISHQITSNGKSVNLSFLPCYSQEDVDRLQSRYNILTSAELLLYLLISVWNLWSLKRLIFQEFLQEIMINKKLKHLPFHL